MGNLTDRDREVAAAVRNACITAALEGYENAGLSGLCHEGRWELAVSAIRAVDLEAVIETLEKT